MKKEYGRMQQWRDRNILDDIEKAVGEWASTGISTKKFSIVMERLKLTFYNNSYKTRERYFKSGILPESKKVNGKRIYSINHVKSWVAIGILRDFYSKTVTEIILKEYGFNDIEVVEDFLRNFCIYIEKHPYDREENIVQSSLALLTKIMVVENPKQTTEYIEYKYYINKIKKAQKLLNEVAVLLREGMSQL